MNLKFGRAKITTNEKIVLASMFYPLYALAVQLSPEQVRYTVILRSQKANQYNSVISKI